jgi:hypothetical protein
LPMDLVEYMIVYFGTCPNRLRQVCKLFQNVDIEVLSCRRIQRAFRQSRFEKNDLPGSRVLVYNCNRRCFGSIALKTQKKYYISQVKNLHCIDVIHDCKLVPNTMRIKYLPPWKDEAYVSKVTKLRETIVSLDNTLSTHFYE